MQTASRAWAIALALFAGVAGAQGTGAAPAADPALVESIKQQVLRELHESGALDRAVDAGVERFVARQRASEQPQQPQQQARTRATAPRPVSRARDHIRGNPDAPVTLIEYSDFECPFCKRFQPTLKRVVDESRGQVRWVYRHFPLEALHPLKARKEAVASECAAELGGPDAFWKFADRLFELSPSHNRTVVETVLPQVAREIGLDQDRFAACLTDGRHDQRVARDVQEGFATGGQGTPWTLVLGRNGKTYQLSGAQPYGAVRQLVDLALEQK